MIAVERFVKVTNSFSQVGLEYEKLVSNGEGVFNFENS
jgi:hypothetical protein